uniref:NAD(P)(+)--arginine ADP-ribosyltransferase n=1 Tax=Salmo trutta TaxID=8032 RepID=A0A673YC71_SALTR
MVSYTCCFTTGAVKVLRRDNILTIAVLCVFHDWTLGVDSKMVHLRQPGLNSLKPLDMVPYCVDDMYNGCTEQMHNKVQKEYLEHEIRNVGIFKQAWMKAEGYKLTHDHIKAICAYSGGQTKIYPVFNQAVRSNRTEYSTSFQFHSLHFLLTDALRLLKENQQGCQTTYQRTNMEFGGEVNQLIRFGFFASKKSCFEIKTCAGAYLKSYPVLGEQEKEVLIPPFEMFKITKKEKGQNVLNCKSLFKLESVGFQYNLNCKLHNVMPTQGEI